ncbi:MAG: ribosome biogenesis GTPase Der [Planctomycetota bacterium]|jgi:GTP-binding protein
MSLPVVAIVGRPNVGKSSLLNCLAGKRIAIVDATPGVTRDRISVPCALGNGPEAKYVELVDTGGMGIEDTADLTEHVETQITYAIAAATLILFIVDAREGLAPLDRHVAERLRRCDKPVLLLANKVDRLKMASELGDLHRLGFGEPMAISATHSLGISDLLERIAETLGDAAVDTPPEPVMKLAVVGKRNAGKSTFINALAGQQRVIVHEAPGTTRDSVDVTIELGGRTFTLIDTAGVRKKKSLADDIEFYSYHRAMRSIRRCDVVAMMIDASVPISQVDKSLAGVIAEQFKPVVLTVNKWDLVKDKAIADDYEGYFAKTFPHLAYAPISLTSATQARNVRATIELGEELFDQARTRVPTGPLNAVVGDILKLRGPSHKGGTRRPKILYVSQIATAPPTIVCFVNDLRSFRGNYERFLLNQLRERLPFSEVPIRLIFRSRRSRRK